MADGFNAEFFPGDIDDIMAGGSGPALTCVRRGRWLVDEEKTGSRHWCSITVAFFEKMVIRNQKVEERILKLEVGREGRSSLEIGYDLGKI